MRHLITLIIFAAVVACLSSLPATAAPANEIDTSASAQGSVSTQTDMPSDLDLSSLMVESIKNALTYKFNFELNLDQNGVAAPLKGDGAVNLTARKMMVTVNANNSSANASTAYAINDVIYTFMDGSWSKMPISSPDDLWSVDKAASRESDLVSKAQVSLEGEEAVDGEDCYKLKIVPDMKDSASVLAGQISPLLSASMSEDNSSRQIQGISQNTRIQSWTIWISKKDRFQKKSSIQAEINLTPEIMGEIMMGAESKPITIGIDATIFGTDQNSKIDIVLPEDATKGAGELISPGGKINLPENVKPGAGGSLGGPATSPVGNNQLGDAFEVRSGQSVKQTISPKGTINWYKIWAGTNGILRAEVVGAPQKMRPDIKLYDKNFNLFEDRYASVAGDDVKLKRDIPAPGWIYIAVYDAEGRAYSEPYTLNVEFNPVQDAFDPNNVLGDAAEVQSGQTVTASICPKGELDWYKIKAGSNGILSVNIQGVPKDMRPDVKFYDRDFNLFEDKYASVAGDELRVKRDVPAPGRIYIAVYDADGKARAEPYTMAVDFRPVQDSFDPNNFIGDAAEVQSGQTVTASICPRGELDWFKINAGAGGLLSVSIEGTPKDMRPDVKLYDKNFNLFEDKYASVAGDNLKFEKDVPLPGWVYIAVYDADGKPHTEPYTMTVA